MLSRATVHGRFQPPHLEHLEYMEAALGKTDHLQIGITQPDVVHLAACPEDPHRAEAGANPLSYDERCEAIRRMLIARSFDEGQFSFVPFPIEQPNRLKDLVQIETVCFTTVRDEWNLIKVDRLKSLGYDVRVLWDRRGQPGIQGTEIRRRIKQRDDSWKSLVHPSVANYLVEAKIIDRMG